MTQRTKQHISTQTPESQGTPEVAQSMAHSNERSTRPFESQTQTPPRTVSNSPERETLSAETSTKRTTSKQGKSHRMKRRAPKKSESVPPKAYANGCPLPGTEEAKIRTLWASISRCKDWKAILDCLAKRDCTEDQLWESAEAKRSQDLHTPKRAKTANSGDSQYVRLRQLKMSYGAARYYETVQTHSFCIIARLKNLEGKCRTSNVGDYNRLTAFHIESDGNGALATLGKFLSATSNGHHQLRECLKRENFQAIGDFYQTYVDRPLRPLERADEIAFSSTPTYVIDVTDPKSPRYCHFLPTGSNLQLRSVSRPPTDHGLEFDSKSVVLEAAPSTDQLSYVGLVEEHAINSVWPHLELEVPSPPSHWLPEFSAWLDAEIAEVDAYELPWTVDVP